MTGFYKMDPAAWNTGTDNLSLEEEAAYLRLVNAMHITLGPIRDHDRVLSGLFRCSTRKARALIAALVAAGKITVADGWISNDRAERDLSHRGFVSGSRAESGAKGGRTRAANAAKALEDNEAAQANASSREEKRRGSVETSVSTAPDEGLKGEEPTPADPVKVMFDAGVRQLGEVGMKPDRARSMLGRWKKLYGTEAVLVALGKARRDGTPDPVSFIEGVFRYRAKPGNGPLPIVGQRKDAEGGRTLEYAGAIDGWVEVRG